MKSRQIRALGRELVRDLDLDPTASTEAVCVRLCELMASRQGTRVLLRFADLGDGGTSGIWAVTEDGANVIIVTTARSWLHRLFIVLHEIAHMVCGHAPIRLAADEGRRLLYPDLSPRMLTMIAGRTDLRRQEEREADRMAAELARALFDWAREQRVRPFTDDTDDLATRAWYSLGYSPLGRHG